jgi:hypothetical protein
MKEDGALIVNGISIDPSVLRKASVHRCALVECMADCCSYGVWLQDEAALLIRKWRDAIKERLPHDRHDTSKWLKKRKNGYNTRTVQDPQRPEETCCIFLQLDRKCALQAVSNAHDLGWPGIKPFFCAIYPLYFEDGVMRIDDETELNEETAMCRRFAPGPRAMYELYPDETTLILGKEGYRELHERAQEIEHSRKTSDDSHKHKSDT